MIKSRLALLFNLYTEYVSVSLRKEKTMTKKSSKNTAAVVRELLEGTVNSLGFDLWDVEYFKEGADMYLRITIDSPAGIDITDCERVHRVIDPIIDEADPIDEAYRLEGSSPVVERQLRTPSHFESCIGERVTVKLFSAIDGIAETSGKQLTGILKEFDPASKDITVEANGKDIVIPWNIMSRTNIYFDFGD